LHRKSEKTKKEGTESPLFSYLEFMDQDRVKELVDEALAENKSLYLIDLSFLPGNKIQVVVDGDSGVPISECIRISRNVEHNLDREQEDFALEVTSPDIARPLTVLRQYKKNVGRILKVKTNNEEYEGTLTTVDDKGVELQWKAREPKPVGKGKVTVEKKVKLDFQDIIEAKVKIIF